MYEYLKEINIELESTKVATDLDVENFEKELSIQLGIEYKTFLKEFGTLEVDYFEFYGVIGDNNSVPSAIHATKYTRENIENFPHDLIIFYEVGDGSFYCVNQKDEVYMCNFNRCSFINMTFKEFIIDKIKTLISE